MANNILIISPSWIGDCVMSQPMLGAIKAQYPDANIDVYAPAWSLPVYERMPEINRLHTNPFGHGAIRLWQRYQNGKSLRAYQYDQVIVLPGSLKSALVPFFAKIPKRTGFVGESRHGLINDIRVLNENTLPMMVDRYAALAYAKGAKASQTLPYPKLISHPEDANKALQAFGLNTDRPVMGFCPGAEYGPAKRWPTSHFAELAKTAIANGMQIWIFGSHKDNDIANEILADIPEHMINLCGKTQLGQAIDLIALCKIIVCNDSGLMHVAAALDRPIVSIYGSSSPDHTPPLSDKAAIATLNLHCSPCFERVCPLGHTDCLNKLIPETVWQLAQSLINANYGKITLIN